MEQEIRSYISQWLADAGVANQPTGAWSTSVLLLACFIIAFIGYYIIKRGVVTTMNIVIQRSKSKWDDIFMRHRVLEKLTKLVPALILNILLPLVLVEHPLTSTLIDRGLDVTIAILFVRAVFSALDASNEIADINLISRRLPIKSFIQLIKLFMFFITIIISISIFADQSPVYFLSGLGVTTGLIMLVFRDTILGFVAGIQLAANRMVSTGDWIQMDKYGADGSVEEVSLTTVKVRNWDKTITMIPAYSLVSDAFKNWRGMSESGGRRIKRALYIDIESIEFLTTEQLKSLAKINHLKDYLSNKQTELNQFNVEVENVDSLPNRRQLTNIGTFRAYLLEYLRQHPQVSQKMTLLVRQLAPTDRGLPLEIYIFTNDTRWAFYEDIQADIFDHIYAVLAEFNLRVFQSPTGADVRSLQKQ